MARASSRVISWNTESEAGRLIHANHPAGFIVSLERAPEALAQRHAASYRLPCPATGNPPSTRTTRPLPDYEITTPQ